MKYRLRKGHKKFFGHDDALEIEEIADKFYHKHKNSLTHLELIEPDDIINVTFEEIKTESERYPGGLTGERYQGLIESVKREGIKNPILIHELPPHHEFWRKKHRSYIPGKYAVNIGNHRTIAAKITRRILPAIVLTCAEETTMDTKEETVFFGPWIGEFGWELMTWQAWCRAEAQKYNKTYVCSFPDMEYLYQDFATFIPHNHQGRALNWHVKENMDKCDYEIPPDVTKQILPFKKYITSGIYRQFGERGKRYGYTNLIHARGIKRGGKDYPLDMWEKLCENLPGTIACIGSEKDHYIEGTADHRGIPLNDLCDLIANSGTVIGQSSGVMHLATLCGAPIIVWGDSKTYFNETLEKRYRETWNPFNSKVWFIEDDNWKPDPTKITDILRGIVTMKKEDRSDMVSLADVPISRDVRDKLAKATSTGRYLIMISCLAPDDKLYHFWKTKEFPPADAGRCLEHYDGRFKEKLFKSKQGKLNPEKKVFEWT